MVMKSMVDTVIRVKSLDSYVILCLKYADL